MLRVVEGLQSKEKPDYRNIYFKAYCRKVDEAQQKPENHGILKQLVFYGVRFMNLEDHNHLDHEVTENCMIFYDCIMAFIGNLTPAELITVFPVDKRYDGEKTKCKDYFYTLNELRKIGMNNQIGSNQVVSLLWDYENNELRKFLAEYLTVISNMAQLQGMPPLSEQLAGKIIYYERQDETTGQRYMQNALTGKIMPIKKLCQVISKS